MAGSGKDKVLDVATAVCELWLKCKSCAASYYRNPKIEMEEMRKYPKDIGWVFDDPANAICPDCAKIN